MMEVAAKDVNSAEVTEFANLVVSTVRAWNKSRVDSNLIYRVNGDYMTWEKEKSVVHPVLPLPFRITKMVPKPFVSHTNVTDLPDVTEKVSKVSSPPNPHGTYTDGSRLRNGSMGCGIVVGSKEDYAVACRIPEGLPSTSFTPEAVAMFIALTQHKDIEDQANSIFLDNSGVINTAQSILYRKSNSATRMRASFGETVSCSVIEGKHASSRAALPMRALLKTPFPSLFAELFKYGKEAEAQGHPSPTPARVGKGT